VDDSVVLDGGEGPSPFLLFLFVLQRLMLTIAKLLLLLLLDRTLVQDFRTIIDEEGCQVEPRFLMVRVSAPPKITCMELLHVRHAAAHEACCLVQDRLALSPEQVHARTPKRSRHALPKVTQALLRKPPEDQFLHLVWNSAV